MSQQKSSQNNHYRFWPLLWSRFKFSSKWHDKRRQAAENGYNKWTGYKKSPKREEIFQKIWDHFSLECLGFSVLRPAKCARTLKSILDNWIALNSVWISSLEEKLDPEMRHRITEVQAQMEKIKCFFGINILPILLRHYDNFSKTL